METFTTAGVWLMQMQGLPKFKSKALAQSCTCSTVMILFHCEMFLHSYCTLDFLLVEACVCTVLISDL
jgi:hypothetical protein